jgi:hypothetical protein
MILERKNDEILIRLSSNIDLAELQSLIDYLRYKELTTNSKAKQKDVDKLADEVNQSILLKIKRDRLL